MQPLGVLPQPDAAAMRGTGVIANIDPLRHRLYFFYPAKSDGKWHIIEYDTTTAIPSQLRDSATQLDPTQVLTPAPENFSVQPGSTEAYLLGLTSTDTHSQIYPVDLGSLTAGSPIDMTTVAPGFVAFGLNYSPRDGLVYVVGEMDENYQWAQTWITGRKLASVVPTVLAIDPRSKLLVWVKPVPQCQQVLTLYGAGTLLARTSDQSAFLFACVTGGSGSGDAFPGQSGIAKLTLPANPSGAMPTDIGVDFFPVSGAYFNGGSTGVASYDELHDRFFLQSLSSTTPGAWVFDVKKSAFVGFIAAPDNGATNVGVSARTGHYFMGSDTENNSVGGYMVVSDAAADPPSQGEVFNFIVQGLVFGDPATGEVYVRTDVAKAGFGSQHRSGYVIMADHLPSAPVATPADYDGADQDIPEGTNTFSTFAGNVNGFGTRALLVGGYGGIASQLGAVCGVGICTGVAGLSAGNRGLLAAEVPKIDLRNVGSAASAQALAPDDLTAHDYQNNQQVIGAQTQSTTGQDVTYPNFPYQPAACLDSTGQALSVSQPATNGSAQTSCDLSGSKASASTQFGAIDVSGVNVASSSFTTTAEKSAAQGTVTQTETEADGVSLSVPNGGSLSIGRIWATATTTAHGHPGTATSPWQRGLDHVVITNSSGQVVYACQHTSTNPGDPCNISSAIAAINSNLGMRVQATLPQAYAITTPKGAFAAIRKSDGDYYNGLTVNDDSSQAVPALQLIVFNDSEQKSRLLMQFAAIQASSIYQINPLPQAAPQPVNQGQVQSVITTVTTITEPGRTIQLPGRTITHTRLVPHTIAVQVEEGMAFMLRSPGQALLMAGLWLLFGFAAFSVWRRRSLLGVVS
jgi:hypothetical protein